MAALRRKHRSALRILDQCRYRARYAGACAAHCIACAAVQWRARATLLDPTRARGMPHGTLHDACHVARCRLHATWHVACQMARGMPDGTLHATWHVACQMARGMLDGTWHARWHVACHMARCTMHATWYAAGAVFAARSARRGPHSRLWPVPKRPERSCTRVRWTAIDRARACGGWGAAAHARMDEG
jgi:hypothetical protein